MRLFKIQDVFTSLKLYILKFKHEEDNRNRLGTTGSADQHLTL